MCLTQAGRVSAVTATEAVVDLDGVDRVVSLAPIVLDGGEVRPGDWVLVHTGMAMEVLDETTGSELADFTRTVRDAQLASE